jgi:hypothetical protein
MEIHATMHPAVRAIIEAFQRGDRLAWLSNFTANARLLQNGKRRDLLRYVTTCVGNDHFDAIDHVGRDGTSLCGQYMVLGHGLITTSLKFQIDSAGKCYQLEIVQSP